MNLAGQTRAEFLLRHLAPVIPVIVILLLMEKTAIDTTISNWFFDPVSGTFPLRHNRLLEVIGHQWAKWMVIALACCVIAMYLLTFVLSALRPQRRLLLFLSLALALAPLAVVILKAISIRHCPWSLVEYGGLAQHLTLFDSAPPGSSPGRCFPSGHASGGFCLLAFYFVGLARGSRALALAGLWGGFAAGMAFGMVRMVQGAHFFSHNLWTALVCWLVILALYAAIIGLPRAATTAPEPGPS